MSYKECVRLNSEELFAILWSIANQAPPSMEFLRQEYWSGLPFHSPGALPNPGIESGSPTLWADSLHHQRNPEEEKSSTMLKEKAVYYQVTLNYTGLYCLKAYHLESLLYYAGHCFHNK